MNKLMTVGMMMVVFGAGLLLGHWYQTPEANLVKLEETHSGKFVIITNKADKRIYELVELEKAPNFK